MNLSGIAQILVYLVVLLVLVKPLGAYMARVYEGRRTGLDRVLGPVERGIYRVARIDSAEEQDWKSYAWSALWINLLGVVAVYVLARLQSSLPLNPAGMPAVPADLGFNTAISFVTNTNWQAYGGEATLSYLTQMLALGVQNFLSAATGMAVLIALIRGFARRESTHIGNFHVDLVRGVVHVLLPLSLVLAIVLVSQGVVQSFAGYGSAQLLEPVTISAPASDSTPAGATTLTEQVIPLGPAASQIAIKQLGTNGGGFFNANSAHPFENPTPLSNFLQVLAILLIPAALCYTFGRMVGDTRQGWAVLAAMLVLFVPPLFLDVAAESQQSAAVAALGVDQQPGAGLSGALQSGGNMEGKETRFGIANSSLWAVATTAASNGSVNSMHDSFTPLGGLIPMFMIQLGEVVFGGVGSGLYGMLAFAIVAVFIAGLMVGRTPEYLGKKIGAYEMKMASIMVLLPCALTLLGTAVAVITPGAAAAVANPGAHGFSEILYAFSSAANNNGSAFGGLGVNTPFYNLLLAVIMWLSRFWLLVPVLAIAGSLAGKRAMAINVGTLPTHGALFVLVLVFTVLLVGALNFVPALALGPIAEHLQSWKGM